MSYSYTNTTPATDTVSRINLGLDTNYATITDDPTVAKVSNRTASLEQPEVFTFKSVRVGSVDTPTKLTNPPKTLDGVKYTIKLETINRKSIATGEVVDEPFCAWLTIEHGTSDTWTNSTVVAQIERLLGSCKTGDGTTSKWRFEDLMRSALVPYTD
jgi:hypothetical protein